MNYFFFSRRISDVDHIVPVFYSLLDSVVKHDKIFYYQLFPDFTLKNIQNDERIIFLKEKNIFFDESSLSKIYLYLCNFSNIDFKINILSKIYALIYQSVFYIIFNF